MGRAGRIVAGTAALFLLSACATATSHHASAPTPVHSSASIAVNSTPAPEPVATTSAARSAVGPVRTACSSNRAAQLVLVSLREQHLWLCARHRVVRSTPITSGMSGKYTETPTGRYTIQGRNRHTTLTLADGSQYAVDYWIPFDAPLYGFHDASWQTVAYGSQEYRTRGSHGCVHVPHTAIAYLYRWARIGTAVLIH